MRKSVFLIICLFIFGLIFLAEIATSPTKASVEPAIFEEEIFNYHKNYKENNSKVKKYIVTVTGYSPSIDETDDTPYVTASGEYVKDGTVATNFLPFGTKIKIPSLFGDKIFVVQDRMHERYYYRVDIWFPSKQEALDFGIHSNIEILVVD